MLSFPLRLAFAATIPLIVCSLAFLGVAAGQFLAKSSDSQSHQLLAFFANHVFSFYGLGIEGYSTQVAGLHVFSVASLVAASLLWMACFSAAMWLIEKSVSDVFKRNLRKVEKSDIAKFKYQFQSAINGDKDSLRSIADSFR